MSGSGAPKLTEKTLAEVAKRPLIFPIRRVPLFSNQALGIALFSYLDGIYFGLNADSYALPGA